MPHLHLLACTGPPCAPPPGLLARWGGLLLGLGLGRVGLGLGLDLGHDALDELGLAALAVSLAESAALHLLLQVRHPQRHQRGGRRLVEAALRHGGLRPNIGLGQHSLGLCLGVDALQTQKGLLRLLPLLLAGSPLPFPSLDGCIRVEANDWRRAVAGHVHDRVAHQVALAHRHLGERGVLSHVAWAAVDAEDAAGRVGLDTHHDEHHAVAVRSDQLPFGKPQASGSPDGAVMGTHLCEVSPFDAGLAHHRLGLAGGVVVGAVAPHAVLVGRDGVRGRCCHADAALRAACGRTDALADQLLPAPLHRCT